MQILIVINQLSLGGTEKHLLALVPELKKRGLDLSVFCFREGGELIAPLRSAGVEVITPKSNVGGIIGLAFIALAFIRVMRERRPVCVHYFLPEAYLLAGSCMRLFRGVDQVLSRRSLNTYHRRRKYAGAIEKRLHQRLSHAVANSKAIEAELRTEGVPADRISVVYNGIDFDEYECSGQQEAELRTSLGIAKNDLVLVVVGNLIPYKGHGDLIEALGLMAHDGFEHWKLLVIGKDTANIKASLIARAAALNIVENIIWLGQQRHPGQYLSISDVGISASHEEGFSNSILEYMAADLAIVATDVGGTAEALVDGSSGLLVRPHDYGAMAEAIDSLARKPALRKSLADAARARVKSEFSLETCVSGYLQMYERMLAENRG